MRYTLQWHERPGILLFEVLVSSLNADDLHDINHEIIKALDECPFEAVYYVAKATGIKEFPKSITAVSEALRFLSHPKLKGVVLVGNQNPLLTVFGKVLTRHLTFHTAATIDAALKLIPAPAKNGAH
jgi:hypothetical protein